MSELKLRTTKRMQRDPSSLRSVGMTTKGDGNGNSNSKTLEQRAGETPALRKAIASRVATMKKAATADGRGMRSEQMSAAKMNFRKVT